VASPQALAEAILLITRDESLRTQLRLRGTANLRRYNRRSLAEKTRAIYASVHAQHFT
jgi:glycosyltransferase involved in cell wall biosynthesis